MELHSIPFNKFKCSPIHLFDEQWLLLTAGDYESQKFNSMTISWGSIGVIWHKPFVQVVLRPSRYTLEFMNEYPDFTICAFPHKYHAVLGILGAKSGRDLDKIHNSGLTACKIETISAPGYLEAELIIGCKKKYWQDMDSSHFLDDDTDKNYPEKDYHRIFFGEILTIQGIEEYRD